MAWLLLIVAGLLEVVWASALHASQGFTRPVWAVVTLVALAASIGLLAMALRELPLGLAYGVWVGIGTVGTVIAGVAVLGEPVSAARLACLVAIVGGIAGLKATGG